MQTVFVALIAATCSLASLSGWLYLSNAEQRTALALWHNCPLPIKGAVLIVEADWPGQTSGDTYRCSHAKKSRPTTARAY